MSIVDFHYRYRNPYVAAVQWTGTNRDQILKFVQLVCIEEMGWKNYESAENVFRFQADDEIDEKYGQFGNMLIFEYGLEVDEGQWIVELVAGEDRWLETSMGGDFGKIFEKQP